MANEPQHVGEAIDFWGLMNGPDERQDWGPWLLLGAALVLPESHPSRGYTIELTQCRNAAAVLDWIVQISAKPWCDPATLAGLVRALDDILDPQANLCSWAIGGAPAEPDLSAENVLNLVNRAALT